MQNPAVAASKSLLILGDSLTAGYGLPEQDSYPARLQDALQEKGVDVRVINAGVSGDTTAGGLARLEWSLAENPDAVIVALGGNDALRGIDPAGSRDNLDQILQTLTVRQIPTLIYGMQAPRNLDDAYQQAFTQLYVDLAEKHGALLYPFFLEGVALDPALNQGDLIHPNSDGVDVLVQNTLPSVLELLGKSLKP